MAAIDLSAWLTEERALQLVMALAGVLCGLVVVRGFTFLADFWAAYSTLQPVPVAPGSDAISGHALSMMRAPYVKGIGAWDVIESWFEGDKHIVRARIMLANAVAVSDPEAVKRVFQTRYKNYGKDIAMSYHPFLPILGTGLVTSEGELWQKQRTLIGPALRIDMLDGLVPVAFEAAGRLINKLEAFRGRHIPVNLQEEFRLLTLQVIGSAILSLPPDVCDEVLPQLYLPVMEEGHRRVLRPWRKYLPIPDYFLFKRRMAALDNFIITLMRSRWQDRKRGSRAADPDLLDRIMEALESTGAVWDRKLEVQLCYEVKTFLLAGHETSAAMLSFAMYELCANARCRDKVREEAARVFGSPVCCPGRGSVDDMPYSVAVLKETLRKYSPVPVVVRRALTEDTLAGHVVPAGTMVILHLGAVHNSWSQPQKFHPERFLPGGEYDAFPEATRAYMFVPFIQGPRNCLGQHFSLLEARVVLARLAAHFTFELVDTKLPVRDPFVIPVSAHGGLWMTVN